MAIQRITLRDHRALVGYYDRLNGSGVLDILTEIAERDPALAELPGPSVAGNAEAILHEAVLRAGAFRTECSSSLPVPGATFRSGDFVPHLVAGVINAARSAISDTGGPLADVVRDGLGGLAVSVAIPVELPNGRESRARWFLTNDYISRVLLHAHNALSTIL